MGGLDIYGDDNCYTCGTWPTPYSTWFNGVTLLLIIVALSLLIYGWKAWRDMLYARESSFRDQQLQQGLDYKGKHGARSVNYMDLVWNDYLRNGQDGYWVQHYLNAKGLTEIPYDWKRDGL